MKCLSKETGFAFELRVSCERAKIRMQMGDQTLFHNSLVLSLSKDADYAKHL